MKVAERTGSTDKLLAVADWRQSPLFSDEERLALEYAEAASVTPPTVDDALRTRLATHFDAQALTELTALIGLQNLSARFNSAMDIPAQGAVPYSGKTFLRREDAPLWVVAGIVIAVFFGNTCQ